MTETSFAALRRLLLLRYDDLKARLTRRLGSAELAGEALQDTWLRLEDGSGVAAVRHADAYLFQVAVNIARDRRRAEVRRLTTTEVEALLDVADEMPDQTRVAEARSELRALETVMAELPPRQRAILLAARLDELPRRDIAKRFRISVRLVQRELQEAQDYCAARLRRSSYSFTSSGRETSSLQEPTGEETQSAPIMRDDE
ncbi:RNA polymerase sigma factor [Microbacteriaceae bacterium K1510]|nr:RNA polymerase sigma factor [Microbacteriaceae bacterium K1510]